MQFSPQDCYQAKRQDRKKFFEKYQHDLAYRHPDQVLVTLRLSTEPVTVTTRKKKNKMEKNAARAENAKR